MATTKLDAGLRSRISQGAIYRDIELIESVEQVGDKLRVSRLIFPLAVVLSQDCDLQQEHNTRWNPLESDKVATSHDKYLITALLAPLYNAEHVYAGEHLEHLQMRMQDFKKSRKDMLTQNSNPRYHFLNFDSESRLVPLIVDFKHYFSITTAALVGAQNRCIGTLGELYREDLSQRFTAYLSRIGLPD